MFDPAHRVTMYPFARRQNLPKKVHDYESECIPTVLATLWIFADQDKKWMISIPSIFISRNKRLKNIVPMSFLVLCKKRLHNVIMQRGIAIDFAKQISKLWNIKHPHLFSNDVGRFVWKRHLMNHGRGFH